MLVVIYQNKSLAGKDRYSRLFNNILKYPVFRCYKCCLGVFQYATESLPAGQLMSESCTFYSHWYYTNFLMDKRSCCCYSNLFCLGKDVGLHAGSLLQPTITKHVKVLHSHDIKYFTVCNSNTKEEEQGDYKLRLSIRINKVYAKCMYVIRSQGSG